MNRWLAPALRPSEAPRSAWGTDPSRAGRHVCLDTIPHPLGCPPRQVKGVVFTDEHREIALHLVDGGVGADDEPGDGGMALGQRENGPQRLHVEGMDPATLVPSCAVHREVHNDVDLEIPRRTEEQVMHPPVAPQVDLDGEPPLDVRLEEAKRSSPVTARMRPTRLSSSSTRTRRSPMEVLAPVTRTLRTTVSPRPRQRRQTVLEPLFTKACTAACTSATACTTAGSSA